MTSPVATLIHQLSSSLPPILERKLASLLGAAVADAASRPLHWIYDLDQLNKVIKSDPGHPEFWPQSHSPFYSLPTGENSCYWDEAEAVLSALKNMPGKEITDFNFEKVEEEFCLQFGEGSRYDMARRQEYMQKRARGIVKGPIEGKWLHGGMIKFLQNHAAGKQVCGDPHIKETDGFCCSLPLVAKYAGEKSLTSLVDQVSSTQSTWSTAMRHSHVASKIVEKFILGVEDPIKEVKKEIEEEYPEIYKEIDEIQSVIEVNHTKAVGGIFGRPCYNPGSFMGAIHAVISSDSYEEAVRKTIFAGGCNCSRSFFIGAMIGARDGLKGIPIEWIEKTNNSKKVINLALQVLK